MSHSTKVDYYEEDKTASVRNQYIAAVIVSLSTFCYGTGIGWLSPSLKHLQSPDCPYGAPLTQHQIGSVASLYCVGGLIGTFLFGWSAQKIGRRWTGIIISFPFIISWILKLTVTNFEGLLVARILSGFGGGGGLLIAPLYCLEIGNVRVRGALGSIALLALNAGILFAYTIGAVLSFEAALWVHFCVPITYLIGFYFMPETPSMLVKMNKITEAARSVAWLRNTTLDDENVKGVISNVQLENNLAKVNTEKPQPACNTEIPILELDDINNKIKSTTGDDGASWKLFITSKATCMAFGMGFVLVTINGYVGVFAIINFASDIFHEAGSSLTPDVSAIILSVLQLIGSYVSLMLIERLGRKILLTISSTIFGLCELILGTYFYLKILGYDMSSFGWIPVLALSVGILIDAIGVGPVPLVIINEIFMIQVREIAVTVLMSFVWISEFIQTQFYAPTVDLIGINGVFWFFGSVAVLGGAFCFLCVPETKGKPLDEILWHFDKKLPRHGHVQHIS